MTKFLRYAEGILIVMALLVLAFFAANPLMFKYLLAMIGGSIQAGHL